MTDKDKIREAFEKWASSLGYLLNKDDGGHYIFIGTNEAWKGYQAALANAVPEWIDPNDKTQKKFLPFISQPCLFSHNGITYYGHHTGGSFKTGQGITSRYFVTWDCLWMPLPEAPSPDSEKS